MININKMLFSPKVKFVPLALFLIVALAIPMLLLMGCDNTVDTVFDETSPIPVLHEEGSLYAKAPPITANDTPVDLSAINGTTIVDKSVSYINANIGPHTLLLNKDIAVAGHSYEDILTNTASMHLKTTNASLTIIGLDTVRTISLISQGRMFTVGSNTAVPGIALTLGSNIRLKGYHANDESVVYVQNAASFTMEANTAVSGNTTANCGGGVSVEDAVFIMKDNATVTGNTAKHNGGGVYIKGALSAFTIHSGTIYGRVVSGNPGKLANSALAGAALYVNKGLAQYGDNEPIGGPVDAPYWVNGTITYMPNISQKN